MHFNLSFLKGRQDTEFLKKIIDAIEEAVTIQDSKGETIGFNNKALEILELDEEQPPETFTWNTNWSPLQESGEPIPYDELATTITQNTGVSQKDVLMGLRSARGHRKWLRVNTTKLEHKDDFYVLASFIDVTDRYNIFRETKIKEDRWKLALEGSELGVWDVDLQTEEVYLSDQWYEMLGYKKGALAPKEVLYFELMHPEDQPRVKEELEDYLSGTTEQYQTEFRLRCGDGTWKWVHSSGKIMSRTADGKPKRVAGTNKDISARKAAEEEVFLSRSIFYNAYHYSAIGMALVSPEGNWIDVNPALLRVLGYTKEELIKRTFQDITHPDDLDADLEFLQKTLNGELETYSMEKRYLNSKGEIVWALLTVSLVRTGGGKPQFFISQIIDITPTKLLIADLNAKNDLLTTLSKELETKLNDKG
ncbi:PAS domain S-box protein [Pedobacter sp. SYSU D00535]|uniref:PAS domain-containing protein n=1 Tax=Pedobacter sp. SYSU D00535 TaxID=2810308 RepID=UPI001A960DAB|nr:PAS domain S-box protein [Pedobacter sp. SYSU D00535]